MVTSKADELTLPRYRRLDELVALDLESVRLLLRGGSVIDWQRLQFETREEVREFLVAQELDPEDPASHARAEALKNHAIAYLRRNFEFPIPKPVAQADVAELLLLASGRGHRQLCACTILKVIHVIHHLEARELLSMLPVSDQDVFHLVEQKVYRVIGGMLARGLPILEFIGGRKNKDSLYSKLLSKKETHAAQIYDKLRFRIVTRTSEDIFPVLGYLTRHLFPFNYIVPGESTNTMFDFARYARSKPPLDQVVAQLQPLASEAGDGANDNVFSAPEYRVVHFVVDMPVRLPGELLENAPPAAWALGQVAFAQAEFQIIDRETEQRNEVGDASHDAYKLRQKQAVMRRLKLGSPAPAEAAPRPAAARPARVTTQPPATKPAVSLRAAASTKGGLTPPKRSERAQAARPPGAAAASGRPSLTAKPAKAPVAASLAPKASAKPAKPEKLIERPIEKALDKTVDKALDKAGIEVDRAAKLAAKAKLAAPAELATKPKLRAKDVPFEPERRDGASAKMSAKLRRNLRPKR